MTKIAIHEEALRMRKRGSSINEISVKLKVSKSTVSHWCREIELTSKQLERIARRSEHHATLGLLKASEQQRKNRIAATMEAESLGKNDIGTLSKRDICMVGYGLYWGEGYKKGSQEMGFTNSDPTMIGFYIVWLFTCFGIERGSLILRVSINGQHAHRVEEVEEYWSKVSGVPRSQFTKTSLIKAQSKKYAVTLDHFGTLRVKVRNGTQLRRRVLGSIAAIGSLRK
jgi:predicted transcriptional regulator